MPIPIFYCEDCGEPIIDGEFIRAVSELFRREGSNGWYAHEANEILPEGAACPHCGGKRFRKESDIMDVWFDSGSSHAAVCKERPELTGPADLYMEGADQYLNLADQEAFYNRFLPLQSANMERIYEDVAWFIEKYDYKNKDADWKDSKDAVQRGMMKMKGTDPSLPPYQLKR